MKMSAYDKDQTDLDRNADPLSGAPGAHPIGTGVGAAAGGATGAAIGTVLGGPVGTAVGTVIGAVTGGYSGKAVAEAIDPTVEDAYWRENHPLQRYAENRPYNDYAAAYRTGYLGYGKYGRDRRFEDAEDTLNRDYDAVRDKAALAWEQARHATRAAWERLEHSTHDPRSEL